MGRPPSERKVPAAAKWLGAAGVLPFAFLAGGGLFVEGSLRVGVLFALGAYGAVILSFLGGIHWGMAIVDLAAGHQQASYRRLTIGVLPSLLAWCALLLPSGATLPVLAAGFALMLAVDWRMTNEAEAPAWYPQLRWPLTVAVVASLVLGMLS